mgnify:CR=1 FL=1
MKKKNQMSHTNRYILLGLSIFCVLMMVLSSFSDKVGGPFKTVANVTVIPLQQGMNQIGGWMGDMKDNFSTMKQLKSENKKLREQVDALTTENNYLQEVMNLNVFRNYINWIRIMPNMRKQPPM